ncbi:MAG: Lipopolysaccharide assembly protein A [Rhodocyclaceae bacterium]|nr:Lipopolysaccharide assembly protein A [Rhodocyclaceae bacterium]CAG0927648.1 hypothetical protein RHDC3_00499 [Rhodocyclaceae bacterium]
MESGGVWRCRPFFRLLPAAGVGWIDMRYLVWLLRIALFVVLLGFAVKNNDVVTLRFFFDAAWPLPLVVVMLLFFAAGTLAGLSAALGTFLRQRRQLVRLKQQLGQAERLE